MNRAAKVFFTCILVVLPFTVYNSAVPANPSQWELSIAVPVSNHERSISLTPARHFHVLLRNTSASTQKIWKDNNSWGYSALNFELTDANGKTITLRKNPSSWRKNVPNYWSIAGGETLVLDVYLTNGDWPQLPMNDAAHTYTIRALFELTDDEKAKELGIWVGKLTSSAKEIVFHKDQ